MTDSEKPSDAYGYARPGSRLAEAMHRRGSYVPQSLIYDFEEALRLICIQEGSSEGELQDVKVTPGMPYEGFPYSLVIDLYKGNRDTPAALINMHEELEAFVKGRNDVTVDTAGMFTRISGNNFRDILNVLNDGFIKPHDPEANIDVEGKMNPSWVERSGQSEGQGGGVGSPG